MIRLKGAHRGGRAAVIFGGPSLLARGFDFARLRDRGFVTFLETKALTPWLLAQGFAPDYFLMLFPEKAKDNSLQFFIFRSFLAGWPLDRYLRAEHLPLLAHMREHFDEYFEPGSGGRSAHKRYIWRPHVFLRDSPYDLLPRIPSSRLIVNRALVDRYFPDFAFADRAYYYGELMGEPAFDIEKYFNPVEREDMPLIRCGDVFWNSAAIALYPLLNYMGFREVYLLGMDMSILGSFEYSAPYTFRTMAHYWWFLHRNEHVFSGNPTLNKHGWLFQRPKVEFTSVRELWSQAPLQFTHVYEPWRWAWPIDGVRRMSYQQLYSV